MKPNRCSLLVLGLAFAVGPASAQTSSIALDGTLEQVAPAQQSTVTLTSNATSEVSLEAGKTAYFNSCVFCHGADGSGGHGGPAFTAGLSAETIQRTVAGGRNQMPAFGGFLDAAAIANVSAWVRELTRSAEGKRPK